MLMTSPGCITPDSSPCARIDVSMRAVIDANELTNIARHGMIAASLKVTPCE